MAQENIIDCKGDRCVVGFDGVARASPMDAGQEELPLEKRDTYARDQDHAEWVARLEAQAIPPTKEEKLARMLRNFDLTKEELKELLNA